MCGRLALWLFPSQSVVMATVPFLPKHHPRSASGSGRQCARPRDFGSSARTSAPQLSLRTISRLQTIKHIRHVQRGVKTATDALSTAWGRLDPFGSATSRDGKGRGGRWCRARRSKSSHRIVQTSVHVFSFLPLRRSFGNAGH